ncbi:MULTISPECIES: ATP-binding cassette domain-containing protein [Paenibacillus]|uniref:ABC transporter ATP-binding protein n=1 Tax=Paenibacillus TaxID=44249 RepID=UPI00096C0C85|nr:MULTISPECIES: ATP-binding cassette domain-containing protein [Paenibacillus]MDH6431403.1 energy-coupling factor transporter ATP-binding protein EcfA2 [Paenibacillus sp. PastH-4]MDH6447503.1 energy-coupling factor transporter ATP-binding protein EcfA2 [Paenibacillus sp. PastF-4]MDH6531616.1 energy-coupling factor transporter ATP-binding protein EcfA2 [Paenibacillus sp. PastH-3]OMD88035.1 cobalt ABC transporter ATP-binding protein [Paenibacillus odorifer]
MEIYRIEELSFTFPEQEQVALSNINLTIESGDFITICGKSGCGKSTLLRQLKTILTPHGNRQGAIYYKGQPVEEIDQRTQAAEIGYVLQSPDNQIVTDKVWHELAFGLESLGYDHSTIRLRVAEMASFFGIQTWFHKSVTELSGGQKQLLNLASIMAMHPSVLILDEPTSQLDPIAASDFLETVKKINRELGTTVIMTEHRLEDVLPLTDRLIVLNEGVVIADDTPQKVGEALSKLNHPMFLSMPSPMQIVAGVDHDLAWPVTVKEGRQWLDAFLKGKTPATMAETQPSTKEAGPVVIKFKDVWFKYDKNGPDIIKDLSFEVKQGQFYCIVGGNGTGKTSTLSLMSGILQPYRGKVLIGGNNPAKMNAKALFTNNLGILPQNPQTLFVKKTVELDLYEMLSQLSLTKEEKTARVEAVVKFAELEHLLSMHPYDLSGGEQQRAALAKVLLLEPKILLLDEPTKGLDGPFKEKLAVFLQKLNAEGVTIVMVSHDVEFCAKYAEVCAMFFDGSIITTNEAQKFFAGNSFYTTAANRMARHVWNEGVTIEGVIDLCQRSR